MTASVERVLITGASGFLGACLARELIAAGHEVHLVLRAEANTWRLTGLEGRYAAHQADLRDAACLRRAVAACRPEVIYHLATHGAYPGQRDRTAILGTNLLGTANLLDALAEHDYRALVHTGSSSEYGHKSGPIHEDDRLAPRTDYAVSKAAATLLCQAEAYKGRPVTCVRVFSAYGPWEEPTRLVPYVMGCCLRGESPRVSPGEQPRDFIHADDVIALLQVAARQPAARGQILHAGTGRQSRVRDMIDAILGVCGSKVPVEYGQLANRPDEPTHWVASIERTRSLTGWEPRHDLHSGIEQTWAWLTQAACRAAA